MRSECLILCKLFVTFMNLSKLIVGAENSIEFYHAWEAKGKEFY